MRSKVIAPEPVLKALARRAERRWISDGRKSFAGAASRISCLVDPAIAFSIAAQA
jgi:hypothetical protein